jgi:transcriptional regulator with XRE-family HTH domain
MKYLAKLRKLRVLTQFELGNAIGIDANSIARYEQGRVKPSLEYTRRLASFLGVPVDTLLNGPAEEDFTVTLKYVKTLEGVDEEMNMNGITLSIAEDGFVGVSGGKRLESYDDVEKVVESVRKKLAFGFEHRVK